MKKRASFSLFLLLFLGLSLSIVSLFSSVALYKKTSGQSLNFFSSQQGTLTLTVEANDTTLPLVAIAEPQNTSYTSHRTFINYTASDNRGLDDCWYSLNSGAINVTVNCKSNITGITSSEGSNTWTVYANDSSGNENSSLVTFSVSIDSGAGGGPGGGGGGGGSISKKVADFAVFPDNFNLIADLNEQKIEKIMVNNIGDKFLNVDVSVSGLEDIISADKSVLLLNSGESGEVILFIRPSELGIFVGKIILQGGGIRKEVLVLVNVRSESSLFDVSLTIPQTSRVISTGQDVRTFISLTQVGVPRSVDVNARYLIKDFDGNLLFEESETFFVLGSKSFTKEFPTADYPPGDYVAGIEAGYLEGFASSSAHFTIKEKGIFLSPSNYSFWILVAIFLLVLIVIIFAMRKYKKSGRNFSKR